MSPPCRGAFATFLSGRSYVPGVLCLLRSRTRIGSSCPWVVVYDDRDGRSPLHSQLAMLTSSMVAGDELLPLSELLATVSNQVLRTASFTGSLICPRGHDGTIQGRRLYGSEYTLPWLKLWLWALRPDRYEHLLYIDADILLLTSLDELLRRPPLAEDDAHILAIDATMVCPGQHAFNSGILLFRPSARVLHKLQATAASWFSRMMSGSGWKPSKSCEKRVGDQVSRVQGAGSRTYLDVSEYSYVRMLLEECAATRQSACYLTTCSITLTICPPLSCLVAVDPQLVLSRSLGAPAQVGPCAIAANLAHPQHVGVSTGLLLLPLPLPLLLLLLRRRHHRRLLLLLRLLYAPHC